MSVLESSSPTASLTARQRDVCILISEGFSNKEVARKLGIGYRTVEEHRLASYRRLGVSNVAQLVRKLLVLA